jgi:hypothetical protein
VVAGVVWESGDPVLEADVLATLATAAVVFDGASAPMAAVPLVVLRSRLLPHAASAAPASSAVAPAATRAREAAMPRAGMS